MNSWTRLVVLRGVVLSSVVLLRGRMVGCMVGHLPFVRNRCCYLLGRCYMMGCVASIVVTGTMVLCVMLSVMFPMVFPMVAMVASSAIWGCKGSPNN